MSDAGSVRPAGRFTVSVWPWTFSVTVPTPTAAIVACTWIALSLTSPISFSSCSSSSPFASETWAETIAPGCGAVGVGAVSASRLALWIASRCLLLDRNIVAPTRRTTMPRITALRARPTTAAVRPVTTTREPTAARPLAARTTPDVELTSSVPCCFATTMPLNVAAPPAAGQNAAPAAATTRMARTPFSFMFGSSLSASTGRPEIWIPYREERQQARKTCGRRRLNPRTRRSGELPPQAHEQRLEGERHRELQLLRLAPGGAHELAGALGALQPLARRVCAELLEPVDVHDGRLGACGDDDEVAVPPFELFERGEELVPLGPALCSAHALLGLTPAQLEHGDRLLGLLLRLGASLRDPLEQRLRAVPCVERRVEVHRTRDGEKRLAAARRCGIEQAGRAVETPGGRTRERRHIVVGEVRRAAA